MAKEIAFETKHDNLISELYRGSITAVPARGETELYVWGCAHQTSNWIVLDWRSRVWRVVEAVDTINAPSARHAHTATHFTMRGESYIAVLGGSASSSTDSNPPFADVYIYAVHDRLWLPVPPSSLSQANVEQLTPRLFHSATFVEIEYEPYLVVVGGIFSDRTLAANVPIPTMVNRRALVLPEMRFYNLRLRTWSQPVYVPGRYRHSAALIPSTRNPRLLIIGGRDMRGNLSKETLIIDVKAAFHSLKYSFSAEKPPAEDYGQGVYWSWLAGIVQPLGPYYGHCHLVPYGDSFIIFALPDRNSVSPPPPPQAPLYSSFQPTSSTRNQPRSPEQVAQRYESQVGHSGWALSCSGSVSFRELRKLRRVAAKAELAARSKAALVRAQIKSLPPAQQPQQQPLQLPIAAMHTPTPIPNQASSGSGPAWLWCGVVRSGWGTPTGGEEDLLMMMYQTDGHIFLVPVLLSALGVLRSNPNPAPDSSPGAGTGLVGLLPSLWDGTPYTTNTKLDPSVYPYCDFLLHTSTPNAPPLALHRSILSARSTYFDSLLKSGFTEARTGEAWIEEGYDAAYALCYWIYTGTLPKWLESPGSYTHTSPPPSPIPFSPCPTLSYLCPKETDIFRLEAQYASHASSTLCDVLVAASARMLPSLAARTRTLIRAEHMRVPEVAPVVWRAAEVADINEGEELVRVGQGDPEPGSKGKERASGEGEDPDDWVYDVVRSRMRPSEDRRQFMSSVWAWCCDPGNEEVRAAMEGAKEWLEPGVWRSWVQRCAKVGKEKEGEKDVVMSS